MRETDPHRPPQREREILEIVSAPSHPIRIALADLQTLDKVRITEGKG
jgi:hypothetical protein